MRCTTWLFFVLITFSGFILPVQSVHAQGVTTSAVTGIVTDAQGAVIPGAR
jgi:hypothetical protein